MHILFKRFIQIFCLFIFLFLMLFISKKTEAAPAFEVNAVFIPQIQIEEKILPDLSIKEVVFEEKKLLFTGDSRFVGMKDLSDGEIFFAESGKGFPYFCSLQDSIKNENIDIIVVGFGVNDLYNVKKYVEYLNNNPFSADVYFLTVNPVDEYTEKKYGYTITNKDIDEFNSYIKESAVYYKVLDTNSYLNSIGFETKDGLHYTDETYQNIYEYIIKEIR